MAKTHSYGRKRSAGPKGGSARLRAKIDSGALGDKVTVVDPAAAPLGTDDEASDTPPPTAVTEGEIRSREQVAESFQKPVERASTAQRNRRLIGLAVVVLIIVAVLIALTLVR